MQSNTIRYRDDGSIDLITQELSDPNKGEIQIQGGACGICSWDIATAKLGNKMSPPAPPGHEGVGYVTKVGSDVTGFREGDRVAGGGFATVRNIPVERAYSIPESDLADEYWIVEPVSCAVTGLDHCRIQAGQRIVMIGCGFMGLLILQGLLHAPLDDLIVIDINQKRLNLASKFGVSEYYNVAEMDSEELAEMLKAREIDVVVDTSGSQSGLDLATDIVRRGGLINLFGWLKGQQATFDPTKWHTGGFTVVNSAPASRLRDPFPAAIRLLHKGLIDLRPLVTHVTTLDEYPKLMQNILDGNESYIKGVVKLE
ncbi:zinc-binding dehydrogenase [Chloroflexi bacterium TSY]|nr:zinc-binding dehydrogenase [Chloroflexi bacterium TSY]